MSEPCTVIVHDTLGTWNLAPGMEGCQVSVEDTGASVRTAVVSAPGPQGPPGPAGAEGGLADDFGLSGLADVQISAPGPGDILTFNIETSTWTNAPRSQITDGGNF